LVNSLDRSCQLKSVSLFIGFALLIAGLAVAGPAMAQQQPERVITHSRGIPPFLTRMQPHEAILGANAGLEVEYDRRARDDLRDHRRLVSALAGLSAQRPGTIDAYVVSIALDSDPVFGREAREAATVLAQRFDAVGRTITLAGPDGRTADGLARGSFTTLSITLAHIAEIMDRSEDVLILYATSHGLPSGIVYYFGDQGYGSMSPVRLANLLGELGIINRLLIVNACYAGVFVPGLSSSASIVVAAAAPNRTSFGCAATNDWTYFGDAFVNHALRQPQPLADAFADARELVSNWESAIETTPSEPQFRAGHAASRWLSDLESRMPRRASAPVGRPAFDGGAARRARARR
jgi:hypothetical protein